MTRRFIVTTQLVLMASILFGLYNVANADIPMIEREALIALYNSTDGDNWKNNSGWKTPPLDTDGFSMPGTECTWDIIRCSEDHVIIINLFTNQLTGNVPPQLGNLTNLEILHFNNNQLTGSIPPELGNLTNLKTLSFPANQLTSSIPPELGNLTNLEYLRFDNNQLTGSIPPELGGLANLRSLDLADNQLTGIPPELGNLTNLEELSLNFNQLIGSIPPELSNLNLLLFLDICDNHLFTEDDYLRDFLNNLQPGWEECQTPQPGTGALTVTINPASAAEAGAQWRLDSGAWQNSGATLENLIEGDHTVEFKDVSGWIKPDNQTITIVEEQTDSATGAYTHQKGSLKVHITPSAAVSAGAQWRVDNGEWKNSEETLNGIAVGDHIVEFNTIANFATPAAQAVNIKYGETTTISQTYTAQSGSLTVTISPNEAVSAGAEWRISGGNWHNSGETEHNLAVGNHWIEFLDIAGWQTPDLPGIVITANQATTYNGVYVKQQGSLTVTIRPSEAVAEGAQWRVDEGLWLDSDYMVLDLNEGDHTVEFKEVSGWVPLDSQSITITDGENAVTSGVYFKIGNEGDDTGGGDGGGGGGGGGCFIGSMIGD